ncbi:TerB family tellurite resistance protein [Vibrio sp. SCSIO 43136]|uniref:tellurite resistance TerB family protein n=1 Tax=Vibrio sp. SCSIO 43136 TaxID=2819101 RepID=UPI002074AC89|nr:TerB family tellurite resistance protein [Vibrio sp. SCSIO 43136]USD66455.1 TerB family tellurite resistance protein [Vibrio sp. SCSIO 43136]
MINSLSKLFKQLIEGQDLNAQPNDNPELAIAALFCEVANADHSIDVEEHEAKVSMLQKVLEVDKSRAEQLLSSALEKTQQSASLYDFTSQLRTLEQEQRFDVIKGMWQVAYADGVIDPLEEAVIRKVAELLYVDHQEFIRAKLAVIN